MADVKKAGAAVVLAISLLAAGCSGGAKENESGKSSPGTSEPGKKVELRMAWWGTKDRHEMTEKVLRLFEEKNPNIKVTAEYSGFDGYFEKLNVQLAGKTAPDLFQMTLPNVNDYSSRGAIQDLAALGIQLDGVSDSIKSIGVINGKMYAVPTGINSPTLMYDPEMYTKAGVTAPERFNWDDYAAAAKQITQKLGSGSYGSPDFSTYIDMFSYFTRQKGQSLYKGTELGFTKETVAEYWQYWDKLRKEGSVPPADVSASTLQQELEKQLIHKGKIPLMAAHSNQFSSVEGMAKRSLKMMMWPSLTGGEEGAYVSASVFWSVNAESKNAKETTQLLNFIMNDPEATKILGSNRGVPISQKVRDAISSSLSEQDKAQFSYIEQASKVAKPFDLSTPKGATEVDKLFSVKSQEVQFAKKSVEENAEAFVKEAAEILKKAQ
ncbi:MAG: hypothetical protein K0R57_1981 [Paenibacillaceae bacterium]|nr:hypothetical protein [Paenibacillaceae bacterium]